MKRWAAVIALCSTSVLFPAVAAEEVADTVSPTLIGQDKCDPKSKLSLGGLWVPWDKDPAAFELGQITLEKKVYFVIVEIDRERRQCGKVIAAKLLDVPLRPNDRIGLNCAVLDQDYNRQRSYMGVFENSDLEYIKARAAWVFDFRTKRFETYRKPGNVYCVHPVATED